MFKRLSHYSKSFFSSQGYTLVELAISTSILAMLAVGALAVMEKKNQSDQIKLTEYRLTVIDDALKSFIRAKKYIPCPALPTLTENNTNFGKSENLTLSTSITSQTIYHDDDHSCSHNGLTNGTGAVPVRTLNLSDDYTYDGWGRKFTYRTADTSGNLEDFDDPNFKGDIRIVDINGRSKTNIDHSPPHNDGAIYVIISHGPNGKEVAWRRNYDYTAIDAVTPIPATGLEAQNTNHNGAKTYIQDKASNVFDDMVTYATKQQIVQPKLVESPVRVDELICENAHAILRQGLTHLEENLDNNEVADHLFRASQKVAYMCDNAPPGFRSAVNPSNLPGIVTWLDASDSTSLWQDTDCDSTIATSNEVVGCWKDKSGLNNHAIRTSNKPTYQEGGLASQPAISFTGTNYMLIGGEAGTTSLGNTSLFADANDAFTIFLVGSTTNTGTFLARSVNDTAQRALHIYATNTPTPKLNMNLRATDAEVSNDYAQTPFVIALRWDGSNATGRYFYKDSDYPVTSGAAEASIVSGQKIVLGAAQNGLYNPLTGYISEVIIFDRALQDTPLKGVKSYLANKWNISDGTGNSNCPTGLIFKKTSQDPLGSCHCPEENQEVIYTLDKSSACYADNTAVGKCVTVKKRPVYDPGPITSNLELWLDADDCTSITLNEDKKVVGWADRSVNKYNATAAALSAPLYNTRAVAIANTQRAMIQFNANNGEYLSVNSDNLHNGDNLSIYAVSAIGDTKNRPTIFSTRRSNEEGSWQLEFGGDGDTRLNGLGITGIFNDDEIWAARSENNKIYTGTPYIFEYIRSNTNHTLYINGQLQSLTDNDEINHHLVGNNTAPLIGAGTSLNTNHWMDGGIGELLIYNTEHDTTNRNSIENYLSDRWGITLNVPTNPNPGNIPVTPAIWLDADKPNGTGTAPSNNSTMSYWTDRISSTQYAASGSPRYLTDQQNGKAAVQFGSGASYFTASNPNSLFPSGNVTIVSVHAAQDVIDDRGLFGVNVSGSNLFGYHSATNKFAAAFTSQSVEAPISTTSSFSGTSNYVVNSVTRKSDGQVKIYHNGNWQGAGMSSQSNFTNSDFYIGGTNQFEHTNGDIRIAEFIAYNASLTPIQRNLVERYLGAKWDINVAIDNTGN